MKWNKRDVVPPLGKRAIELGNKDGGLSIPLLFKHQSGLISFGKACMVQNKVAWWFAGGFGDDVHSTDLDEKDPVVEWSKCPNPAQVVEAFDDVEFLQVRGKPM